MIEMITYGSTLFAGDVLSLGGLCAPVVISGDHTGVTITMKASGLPELSLTLDEGATT